MHVQVQLTVPFSRTAFSSKASFEVRSSKLLNVSSLKASTICRVLAVSPQLCERNFVVNAGIHARCNFVIHCSNEILHVG